MKMTALFLLGAVMLTACHHSGKRNNDRRDTPTYHRSDNERREYRTRRNTTDDMPYRLHSQQGFLPPVGMRWDCPTEPQMLGYVTR